MTSTAYAASPFSDSNILRMCLFLNPCEQDPSKLLIIVKTSIGLPTWVDIQVLAAHTLGLMLHSSCINIVWCIFANCLRGQRYRPPSRLVLTLAMNHNSHTRISVYLSTSVSSSVANPSSCLVLIPNISNQWTLGTT